MQHTVQYSTVHYSTMHSAVQYTMHHNTRLSIITVTVSDCRCFPLPWVSMVDMRHDYFECVRSTDTHTHTTRSQDRYNVYKARYGTIVTAMVDLDRAFPKKLVLTHVYVHACSSFPDVWICQLIPNRKSCSSSPASVESAPREIVTR